MVRFAETDVQEKELAQSARGSLWIVTEECALTCTANEKDCITINPRACAFFNPDDQKEYPVVARLASYVQEQILGITYTLRKIR